MSDDEQSSESGTTVLTAEYKNGRLEIVDMPPAKKSKLQTVEGHILEGSESSSDEQFKYIQVLDSDKNVVVDLLNLKLVKCQNSRETYRLVSNDETESGGEETVTCVLSNDDGDEQDTESYVVMDDGEDGQIVFLQTSPDLPPPEEPEKPAKSSISCIKPEKPINPAARGTGENCKVTAPNDLPPPEEPDKPAKKSALTPVEILERAKALQKAKTLMSLHTPSTNRGRRRKSQLPPPHELLSSPQFKLYLYSCKMCDFKCNAIKELTAHKAVEHAGARRGTSKWRSGIITLQCARCPYRASTHSLLMKHVKDKHQETTISTSSGLLSSEEVSSADVLVCGACGFESAARDEFKRHIEEEHGVSAC